MGEQLFYVAAGGAVTKGVGVAAKAATKAVANALDFGAAVSEGIGEGASEGVAEPAPKFELPAPGGTGAAGVEIETAAGQAAKTGAAVAAQRTAQAAITAESAAGGIQAGARIVGQTATATLSGAAGEASGRVVALDTDIVVKFSESQVQAALQASDRLVVTPNVVQELTTRVGIKDVTSFLSKRGISQVGSVPGAAVPASTLRQVLDQVILSKGNAGDALNISEAAGANASVFLTNDANTIGRTFGFDSSLLLPNSGGAAITIQVVK